jgi:regulatory protein
VIVHKGQDPDQEWDDPGLSTSQEESDGKAGAHSAAAVDEKDPHERARNICLTQLSFAARTRSELAKVLAKREIPVDVAEAVLDRFTELGLINDTEFAAAWARSRQRSKGLAARSISRELEGKGIADEDVDAAMAQLSEESEFETAVALVTKRLRTLSSLDHDVKVRRLVGLLARKGYSPGLSYRVVREVLDTQLADPE